MTTKSTWTARFAKLGAVALLTGLMTAGLSGCGDDKAEKEAAPKKKFVTIGTGGVTGVYYPTGGAIAKMVNKKNEAYGIKATAEATGGSAFNVNAIIAGEMEFGIVQSDRQYQAFHGLAEWKGNPQPKLRSIFSIHAESVSLLAAEDAGINSIADLKGKKVNIGNPGSGQRQNAIDVLTTAGINAETDLQAESLKASEAAGMLQDKRIDAFFYTVGHPNGSFKEATAGARKVKFVPIESMDKLLREHPYYAKSTIPVSHYPNAVNKADVPSIGVKATFCTNVDVSEDVVYAFVKEVFENLEEFKSMHPAYGSLTKENMLEGLSAPIHEGAQKYYREAGIFKR